MITHAQNKEDFVLAQYFQERENAVFVDVGAHDGVQLSNTYLLEKELGWTGVCIEPHPHSFKALKKNRPNSYCFELASVNHDKHIVQLKVPNNTAVLGSVDQNDEGVARILGVHHQNIKYKKHRVKAQPLWRTLQTAGFGGKASYELLSIDTEWTELDVLKSATLHWYTPEVIVVEANDKTYAAAIKDYLLDYHYHLCGYVGGINYFFVKDDDQVERMRDAIQFIVSGGSPNLR
jgi:FkbM family methyltransferase